MTRTRYMNMFIGVAIGNLISLLIYTYLSGEPWTFFISRVPMIFVGLAFVVLLTWGTWTREEDDAK